MGKGKGDSKGTGKSVSKGASSKRGASRKSGAFIRSSKQSKIDLPSKWRDDSGPQTTDTGPRLQGAKDKSEKD